MKKRLLEECYEHAVKYGSIEEINEIKELLDDQLEWESRKSRKAYSAGRLNGMILGVVGTLVAVGLRSKI